MDNNEIDEKKLMKLMALPFSKDRKFPELENMATPSKISAKKDIEPSEQQKSFKDLFFEKSDFMARNGKSVYIRKEYHELLIQISFVIAKRKISISNYLDNILRLHFEQFEADIQQGFKTNNKLKF